MGKLLQNSFHCIPVGALNIDRELIETDGILSY